MSADALIASLRLLHSTLAAFLVIAQRLKSTNLSVSHCKLDRHSCALALVDDGRTQRAEDAQSTRRRSVTMPSSARPDANNHVDMGSGTGTVAVLMVTLAPE
jgi:hypothetical protein